MYFGFKCFYQNLCCNLIFPGRKVAFGGVFRLSLQGLIRPQRLDLRMHELMGHPKSRSVKRLLWYNFQDVLCSLCDVLDSARNVHQNEAPIKRSSSTLDLPASRAVSWEKPFFFVSRSVWSVLVCVFLFRVSGFLRWYGTACLGTQQVGSALISQPSYCRGQVSLRLSMLQLKHGGEVKVIHCSFNSMNLEGNEILILES